MLLCAAGTSFLIMLDANIVAVALPSIARDLHGEFTDVEWVVSAYILPFAALLIATGALADRVGRRRILLWGLSIFTIASLLCGLAPTLSDHRWKAGSPDVREGPSGVGAGGGRARECGDCRRCPGGARILGGCDRHVYYRIGGRSAQ
jgi:MFS family permease